MSTVRKEIANFDASSTAIVDEFDRFFSEAVKPVAPTKPVVAAAQPAVPSAPHIAAHLPNETVLTLPTAASAKPAGAQQPAYHDPLMAELARIVGQGAPVRPSPAPEAKPADPLAAFEEELRRFDQLHRANRQASQPDAGTVLAPRAGERIEPTFDAPRPIELPLEVPGELRGAQAEPALAAQPPHDAIQPYENEYQQPVPQLEVVASAPAPKARSRKVMLMLGSAAAIAMVGVIGAVATKGRKPISGEVPVIAAKTQPMKEKPADPGGAEIPGQDRQVLAKGAAEPPKGAANVVSKEEQPVDLNQTPKREVSRVILPAPTSSGAAATTASVPAAPIIMPAQAATPTAQAETPPTAGGFEAKRVRSVRVGPEGDPLRTTASAAAPAAAAVAAGVAGAAAIAAIAAAPTPAAAAPVAPAPAAAPKVASLPAPVAATPAETAPRVAAPQPRPAPVAPKSEARPTRQQTTTPAPVRTAVRTAPEPAEEVAGGAAPLSIRPPSGASSTRPVAKATAPAAESGASRGGFAVQLAASPSESDARSTATRLKQQYSALSGYSPSWRSSEVNGRTVYRVRVGGLSRESANDLCGKIKSGGGSCFVASN